MMASMGWSKEEDGELCSMGNEFLFEVHHLKVLEMDTGDGRAVP